MAISTINDKLAVMSMGNVLMPNLPMSPGTLGQDDQQQLLWGYPGVLWGAAAAVADFVQYIGIQIGMRVGI